MPSADPALDEALLAFSRTREAAARACEALADRPEGAALTVLLRLRQGDLAGAQAIELGDAPPSRAASAARALASGGIERALREIEAALAEAPDDPIVLRCAVPLLLLEDADRALRAARRFGALRPHDPAATWLLLGPLSAEGEETELRRLAEDPPAAFAGTTGHLLLRSNLADRRGDLVEAEGLAREAVAKSSDDANAWTQLAKILRAQDRREEAEKAARYALEANPRHHQALRILAMIARKRGDEAEAKRIDTQAKALDPVAESMRPLEDVRRLFKAGRHEDMLDALNRLGALPPTARRAGVKLRLSILTRVGDTVELRRAVEEAKGTDPTTTIARGELLMRDGRYPEARALLEAAWADGRPSAVAQFLLKALLCEDRAAAQDLMKELIADPPGSVMGCLGVVLSLLGSKMEKEYVAFLDAARRRFPHSRSLLLRGIRADMAYLRILKAWNACDELDPKERKRVRREIFVFTMRKGMRARWRIWKRRWRKKA